jgi:DNA polymerase
MQAIDRAAAESLIQWWLEAGVDVAVGEAPRGWLRGNDTAAPAPSQPAPSGEKPVDLAAFQAWLATAQGLPMDRAGASRVPPSGVEAARIMLLSDLPDRDDAASGQSMGGESWALTTRMLAAIGLKPDEAYVASLSCFHAPGARIGREELAACAAIARDHVRLARPERLMLFGDAVATFHPRWLLQRPSDKALAWRDLLLLMSESD